MEELKKRKIDETIINGEKDDDAGRNAQFEDLRLLIEPLSKSHLVDLLAKLGSQNPSIAREIKSIASADPAHRKLFVRGLAWNTNSETLRAAFEEHGELEEGAVIYDKATGKSRGYGFITYKNMESAQNALKAPSKLIDGRLAVCNLACEGLNGTSNGASDLSLRKLYIGNLSPEVTSEMLLNYFGIHGDIEEGSVAYDKGSNESRGFGFVTYKTAEAAKKAIDDPEKTLGGRNITVKYADSHKGKGGQQPFHAGVVPMSALPMTPVAVGYTYPQTPSPYVASPYPSLLTTPSPYQTPGQSPYPQVSAKKDQLGLNYYYPKQ